MPVRQLGLSLSILFLSACATIQQTPQTEEELDAQAIWELRRLTLVEIESWNLKGRVAGKSNNEGFRAGVHWTQQPTDFNIDLHGPLGRKVAVIKGTDHGVVLNTSKGESYEAENPEELMQELFGYSLPVTGLRYWMRGVPDPSLDYNELQLDEFGKLEMLQQSGWLIEYKRYYTDDLILPAFIKISNNTLNANLIIDSWSLDQAQ